MKKKTGIEMREVCGEKFLIAMGVENIDMNSIVNLNETAAFLWKAMGDGEFSVDDLVTKLTDEYEVSAEEAKAHIESMLADMRKAEVVEDQGTGS